jgi:hypothetical protein
MPRQILISQPLPLIECFGKEITLPIRECGLERQPAQDGGQDQNAGADRLRRAQLDVDLV